MAVMVEPQMLRQIAMVAAIVAVVAALAGIVNYGWIAILAELFCAAVISLAAHTGVKFGPYSGTMSVSSLSFIVSMTVAPAAGLCIAACFAPFSTGEFIAVALASGVFCTLHLSGLYMYR